MLLTHLHRDRCERMIRTHRYSMRVYKTRQQSLNYSDFQTRDERRNATIGDIEDTLLKIEDELVMENAARRESRLSFSSASTDRRSMERVVDHERNPRSAGGAEQRHFIRRQPPMQESRNGHLPRTTNQTNTIQSRDVLRRHQSQPTSESSSSSVDASRMQIRGEPQPGEALQWDEGDYMAVRPSNRVLHLSPSLDYQIVEGYINSNASPTSANTCHEITENVISEFYAIQLGLQIDYCESDDENHAGIGAREMVGEREIDFGDGDVHSVRTVRKQVA
jgi:hypothetical protein